jgi:hypothetical protein
MKNVLYLQFFFTLCFLFVLTQSQAIVMTSPDTLKCGDIAFKNGSHIKAVITAITADSVKYRICDNNKKTPIVARSKKEISRITASDGAILYRSIEAENRVNESDTHRKFHPVAITGAIFTGLGALLTILNISLTYSIIDWNLILALFAIGFVLSVSALVLIRRNMKQYKGEKLTLAGIVIGGIILGLFLLGIF